MAHARVITAEGAIPRQTLRHRYRPGRQLWKRDRRSLPTVQAVVRHGEALRSRSARITEGEQSSLFTPTRLELP